MPLEFNDNTLEIDDDTYSKICKLCQEGDEYVTKEKFNLAVQKYEEAFDLVPDPYERYHASTWILTAIGDSYFLMGNYERARDAIGNVMYCPEAIGNPFIHLRFGQVQLELGNLIRAQDELARAYMIEGEKIFQDEDPKYLAYVKTVLRLSDSDLSKSEGDRPSP
jgi:tetratricopeptide (TPR) repeat protein